MRLSSEKARTRGKKPVHVKTASRARGPWLLRSGSSQHTHLMKSETNLLKSILVAQLAWLSGWAPTCELGGCG